MNVLVLRALGLGDLLTAVPALRGLRAAFPGATITLAAPGWLADAAARIDAVDRLLPTEPLAPIAADRPDLAVNLHGRGPRSTELLRATRPGALITHGPGVPWPADRHEVLRWCDLLDRFGVPCDPADLRLPPVPRHDAIVVHPGASHAARRWPAERYAEVARALGPDVVVTGSPAEADLARSVGRARVGDLGSMLDLVGGARLVVCGDTGVAHVATAYGTPSVLLFGPVSPAHWGPRGGPHRVLWRGRTGDTFADRPDPGLLDIAAAEVVAAAREMLGGGPWRGSESSARAMSD
ncbi:glycosyltransferase family 9 protein [Saccharothrix obliqua]|uniref:glycosyltransferase family 9 protein n=1 Tax=Saccharothrix obliqua TaxID=2861747 RepID=UPI001C5DAB7A|nr:glycosyltransferase family 9 protein [Saccharothrix obliqua]MBW4720544.1 glycosyltransferase family 9 protein [Saccharothrix obliqua]